MLLFPQNRNGEINMDSIGRIIMTPRRPQYPYSIVLPVPPKRKLWQKKERPDLILIVYDTGAIMNINVNRQFEQYGIRPMYVPAKYALAFHEGWDDSDIFAQAYAISDEYLDKAIWFNDWDDLPVAITQLRERFPEQGLPEQIDYVLDWPTKERVDRRTPGWSIVTPAPPVVKRPAHEDAD